MLSSILAHTTKEGKTLTPSCPAFPYKGDLVVPIEEVRKALGM